MDVKPRVLIADDETVIRLDLRGMLEGAGFDVCAEARDGVEAVDLAAEHQPDLVLLDVKMPRLDGVEAARRISGARAVPIVMLTAYGYGELVARAVDAGVSAYLVKPFRENDLLLAIQRSLDRHRSRGTDVDLRAQGGTTNWPLTLLRRPDGSVEVTLRQEAG
jgi:two-component system, response regulator PdtaR